MTTNVGDGLSVGNFFGFGVDSTFPETTGKGVPTANRVIAYDGKPVVGVANSLSVAAVVSTSATLAAGTGVTKITHTDGNTVYKFDVPRPVLITGNTNTTSVTFTINGYDRYWRKMTEQITGPTTGTAAGAKAFNAVYSITVSGTTTDTVAIGAVTNVVGLPYRVDSTQYLIHAFFDSAADAGSLTVADTTATQTATTGDVLGTWQTAGTFDGSKRLTIFQMLTNTQATSRGVSPTSVFGIRPFTAW